MKFLTKLYDRTIKCFSLILIAAILVYIPLKILSYGWSPNIGMIISSVITQNSDIPPSPETIVESIKSLAPIYPGAVENNLVNIVTTSFILFNIIGLCYASNHIAWFFALCLMMIFDRNFIIRLLSCSPVVSISMLFIVLASIFSPSTKTRPKATFFYSVLLICLLRCTILTNVFTFDLINEKYDYLWRLPTFELHIIISQNLWLFFLPIIIYFTSLKQKTRSLKQLTHPFLATALCLQLGMNLGLLDLAILRDTFLIMWLTETISDTIDTVECFKELRVKHCLGLFILLTFTILATHDNLGRFSKTAIFQMPVDFSMKELKGWAPEPGGILYNDDTSFAINQYYANPNANYHYKFIDTNRLFSTEAENILNIQKMLRRHQTPLPEYYNNWVENMNLGDRLITSAKINGIENMDWLRIGQKLWLGKPRPVLPESPQDTKQVQ